MQMRQCKGRIEVVAQCFFKTLQPNVCILGFNRFDVRCTPERPIESVERALCLLDASLGEIEGLAVVGLEQHQADRLARPVAQQIPHRVDVAEGLGHLLALDDEVAVVHPVARERRAVVGADALRAFVLVVREDEVLAAAVDVEGRSQ